MPKHRTFYQLESPIRRRWPKMPTWLYLLIVLLVAMVSMLAAAIVGAIATAIVMEWLLPLFSNASVGMAGSLTFTLIASFLPLFLFIYLALKLTERRGLGSVGMKMSGAGLKYLRGLGVGFILFGSIVILMGVLGYLTLENPFTIASIPGACLLLSGWIIQGAAEEVLTRGYLLQIFGRTTNSVIGIAVSSLFFMAIHTSNANVNLIAMLNLLLFGVFAALYTLYERGLWGVFAIHSVWNWAQGNLFGFQVSGLEIPSSIVIDLKENGPDLVTGGIYGPEGGLIMTGVMSIAIVWCGWISRQKADRRRRTLSTPRH